MTGCSLSCPKAPGPAGLQLAGSSRGLCFSGTKLATQFPCPRGYYNPDQLTQSLDGCLPCPPGHYCGQENLTQASGPCDAGVFPRVPQMPPPTPAPPTSAWTSHDGTSCWSGYGRGRAHGLGALGLGPGTTLALLPHRSARPAAAHPRLVLRVGSLDRPPLRPRQLHQCQLPVPSHGHRWQVPGWLLLPPGQLGAHALPARCLLRHFW